MAFQFAPLLIGAGMGALGGLLTGRDPLKGALVGGATGGLLGNFEGIKAGAMNLSTGSVPNTGYAVGANPAAFLAPQPASLAEGLGGMRTAITPSGAASLGSGEFIAPNMGLVNTETLNTTAQQMYGADNSMLSNPIMGGLNPLSDADYTQIASTPATSNSSLFDDIKPYFNVRDLTGAAQVAAQYQQRPQMPTAPAGGIQRGQAPQGTDVMALLQTIKQPEKKRISLV